jgi:hypothetical protein
LESLDIELKSIRQHMLIDFTRSNKEGMNIWAGYGKELINIHISSTELAAVMKNVVTGNFKDYAFHLFAKAHANDKSSDLTWEVGVSYRPISILFEDWDLYDRDHPAEEVLFRVKLVNALLGLTKRICIEDEDGKEIKPSDASDKIHGTLAVRRVSSKGKSKK